MQSETGATTLRPTLGARPAPLVLVSEQRIDRPTDTEVVRPRRINTGALAVANRGETDAETVDDAGLHEL